VRVETGRVETGESGDWGGWRLGRVETGEDEDW